MTESIAIYKRPGLATLRHRWRGVDPQVPPNAVLCRRALFMWRERSDLQQAYDISKTNGRIGLFWWCILHGFRELGFRFTPDLDGKLLIANQSLPRLRQMSFQPITWLMRAIWANSSWKTGGIDTEADQYHCLAHFFSHGLLEANLGGFLTQDQARALVAHDPAIGAPRLFGLIWYCDTTLQQQFPSIASAEFDKYCRQEAARDWPILVHPMVGLATPSKRTRRSGAIRGVNLFGHALGRFGVGEDVRMAARSLTAAGIDYVIRNVDAESAGTEEDASGFKLSDTSPFDINLFCMTGMSTITAAIAEGERLREQRYTIGVWPWELPEWPIEFDQAWDFVDEVWATSEFTYAAYCKAARRPIEHMPMAVIADETKDAKREDFGLPKDAFLFGFSFDGLSSIARKNPQAAVEAFRKAFPANQRHVGLVLKGIRADANAPRFRSLLRSIGEDDRIHLINKSLSRGELLDLYRSMNAFVSLHRSEGFGRNIAEAMLLGKPVIATAYSGNMDFTRHDTAALVATRLRPVAPGEYPFGTGQLWGEPDITNAAAAMRRAVDDRAWRERLAENGQALIRTAYSPEVVGAAWAKRLEEIARP